MTNATTCHCGTELTPHEGTGAKEGALHCYTCNCCYLADGITPRPGVPRCEAATAEVVEEATESKYVSQMNKAELLSLASSLGKHVDSTMTVAELREALKDSG